MPPALHILCTLRPAVTRYPRADSHRCLQVQHIAWDCTRVPTTTGLYTAIATETSSSSRRASRTASSARRAQNPAMRRREPQRGPKPILRQRPETKAQRRHRRCNTVAGFPGEFEFCGRGCHSWGWPYKRKGSHAGTFNVHMYLRTYPAGKAWDRARAFMCVHPCPGWHSWEPYLFIRTYTYLFTRSSSCVHAPTCPYVRTCHA